MLYLFFLLLSILGSALLITALARAFIYWRNNIPVGLYLKALRDENSGHFEEAVTCYEAALSQCEGLKFQRAFKNKIIGKMKLLHTIIEYNKTFRFVR
jgi:hypothetical protein